MASAALKAMRLSYWLKNTLIIVPLVASGELIHLGQLGPLSGGFISLSFAASAGYLLNDLLDKDSDARSGKSERPIASGQLGQRHAVGLIVLLLLASALLGLWLVGFSATTSIFVYFILSAAYSLFVRRQPGYELLFLGLLHSLRIWIGFEIFDISPSFWLLALSLVFFTAMASAKRLGGITADPVDSSERGYKREDSGWLLVSLASLFHASLAIYGIYLYERSVFSLSTTAFIFGFLAFILFMALIQHLVSSAHKSLIHSDAISWILRNNQALVIICGLVITNFILIQLLT